MVEPSFKEYQKALMSRISTDIPRFGHTVIGILPREDEPPAPPFFYTVGRHSKNLPELLMVGPISGEQGMDIVNAVAAQQGTGFHHGQLVDLGSKCPVMIIDATDPILKDKYTNCVNAYYRTHNYRVQQILLPDRHGVLPPGCDSPFDCQPILGKLPELV